MKNKFLLTIVITLTGLSLPTAGRAQAPNLGTAVNYVLFSTIGAVSNAGISQITGNAGSNNGATTGFATLMGQLHNADPASAQCSIDLLSAYTQLNADIPTMFPGVLLGNGQILNAGVYSIPAAASLNLTLTLNGQGNPNAVFIFQINGAFSTTSLSKVVLINGASPCNVFWKVEGAVSMAAASSMVGTIIANNAAISMAAGDTLQGRALSTTGAVAVDGVSANVGCGFIILPVGLSAFTGACMGQNVVLRWSMATAADVDRFAIERSAAGRDWQVIGTVAAGQAITASPTWSFTDNSPGRATPCYRLMQIAHDGNKAYGPVVAIDKCGDNTAENLVIFPNPSRGKFGLSITGGKEQVNSVEIFNSFGEKVFASPIIEENIDLSGRAGGIYIVELRLNSKIIRQQLLLLQN